MIREILCVGAGSFIGGALRYAVAVAMRTTGKGFPWATLTVNIAGCLVIGLLWGALSRYSNSQYVNLFLTVGICGGFTTFSTFSKESFAMLPAGNWLWFALYVGGSVALGLLMVAAGYHLSK